MTQKTKLEIIGPYTPKHEGPFCTREGLKARIIRRDRYGPWSIVALVSDGEGESVHLYSERGRYSLRVDNSLDLMNAREVPVAREFWVNEYEMSNGDGTWFGAFTNKEIANINKTDSYIRTIHVREVLPGDDQ